MCFLGEAKALCSKGMRQSYKLPGQFLCVDGPTAAVPLEGNRLEEENLKQTR